MVRTALGERHLSGAWVLGIFLLVRVGTAGADPATWAKEFPKTDFARHSVDLTAIASTGPRRDTIPPIDAPRFVPAGEATEIGPFEPVVSLAVNGDMRAYPLRMLLWHEIVNDTVGGVPVVITYCPLCNSAVVFDRRVAGRVLAFGNTGRIRHYDMVMYDRRTESWWQQFLGEAIVGEMTGTRLVALSARIESLGRFRQRAPEGRLLVPEDPKARPYGVTPFAGYDGASPSLPYDLPRGLAPLARVIVVGDQAWSLELLRREKTVATDDLVITWEPGQNSIHDARVIAFGRRRGQRGRPAAHRERPGGRRLRRQFRVRLQRLSPEGVIHAE